MALRKTIRDAHEREKSCSNEPEQMLTCSNGEERSEHIGLGLGLILWNTKTGRVQHIILLTTALTRPSIKAYSSKKILHTFRY